MNRRVGVIDVGSNSIKALVAESIGAAFEIKTVYEHSLGVRISHGIGGNPPMLQPARIQAGIQAVAQLWQNCHAHGPLADFRIVATSAVRSAANGKDLLDAVQAATGCRPDILTGEEEADGIACGVRTDPSTRILSRTSWHLERGTSGSKGGALMSYITTRLPRPTTSTSLWPAVVRIESRAPSRSSAVFVATVVP